MIVPVTLAADNRVVSLSADHVLLMEPAEGGVDKTEITMVNGKKFVVNGKVEYWTNKFNVSR